MMSRRAEIGSVPVMTEAIPGPSLDRDRNSTTARRRTVSTPNATDIPGFEGELIGPADGAYEEARQVYNAMIDRRPALVARCAGADDVARVVSFAAENDVLLAVRGGGHNGARLG